MQSQPLQLTSGAQRYMKATMLTQEGYSVISACFLLFIYHVLYLCLLNHHVSFEDYLLHTWLLIVMTTIKTEGGIGGGYYFLLQPQQIVSNCVTPLTTV